MKRYFKTYKFFDTEEQASRFCENENGTGTAYKRKRYKAHYAPWVSQNGAEHKFLAWYYW